MKTKEFIEHDALKAVEADRETAGKIIAENLGWNVRECLGWGKPSYEFSWHYQLENWQEVKLLAESLDVQREAERAVIEKVGAGQYGAFLKRIVSTECEKQNIYCGICEIATASAEQRIAAMLTALAEVEDE